MMAHTIRAATLTGYAKVARSVGLAPLRLLDAVGIPRAALSSPDLRISALAVRDLMNLCGQTAEDFGLRMYDERSPSDMGPVALIARDQPTVRAVLETLNQRLSMHSDVTRLQIEDAGDISTVRLVQTWPTPGPERQVIEMAMGQLMRTLRLYLGVNWQALSVSLPHAPPQVMDTHRRILGKAIQFDQPFAGVVCRRSDLDRVNPVANPEMARHMERLLNDLEHPEEVALALKVRAIVGESLPTRPATAVSVANELGLDPRTLQRQLAVAGTSFVEIVQALRFELASRYLREDDAPLSDVAKRLGFSELSAFSRWHRKHYGQSASAHRGSIRAAERPLSMA